MADALEYVVASAIDQMRRYPARHIDSIQAVKDSFGRPYGINISDEVADLVARRLEQLGFLRRVSDQYAGTYFIPSAPMNTILKIGQLEKSSSESALMRALSGGTALFERAFKNSEFWTDLERETNGEALPSLVEVSAVDSIVPASDRIVTLSHNQQIELEQSSTDVIDSLSKENSIDGDVELKDRILGQVRAARELIRSQSVRAYLLYETVFVILGSLIERYKGEAIGHAAKRLLDLLIDHIFKN